jgi:type II secretory pathway pseudopilin PulG
MIKKSEKGISLIEVLVYIGVFSLVMTIVVSFVFWFIRSNTKAKVMREVLDSSKRVMEMITQEIKESDYVYLPTTSATQLSLKTRKYPASGEEFSYLDFYLCDSRICLKKESQDPIYLTPENIEVNNLVFTQIMSGDYLSIRINLGLNYNNINNRPEYEASVDLTSTASSRSY